MQWMKIAEAAEYAHVSRRLLYRAAQAGRLRVSRVGLGRNLVTCAQWIDTWLQQASAEHTKAFIGAMNEDVDKT